MRHVFYITNVTIVILLVICAIYLPAFALYTAPIFILLFLIGLYDSYFSKDNIIRDYPVVGHLRYLLLYIRPHIRQYFVESPEDGKPYNWEIRRIVYERAKKRA